MQNPDPSVPVTHPWGDVLKMLSLPRGMLVKFLLLGCKAFCSNDTRICQKCNPKIAGTHLMFFKGFFKSTVWKTHSLWLLKYILDLSLINREWVWTPFLLLFAGPYSLILLLGLVSLAATEERDKNKIQDNLLLKQLIDCYWVLFYPLFAIV